MGKTIKSGYGYGMTEQEAIHDFERQLTYQYGSGLYQGGAQDIRNWLKSKCEEKPVIGKAPKQTNTTEYKKEDAILVNGFIITTHDEKKKVLQSFNQIPIKEQRKYSLTQTDAKKIAKELTLNTNDTVFIFPSKLWKDKFDRLSEVGALIEVSPKGGTKDQKGKWFFEVECAD